MKKIKINKIDLIKYFLIFVMFLVLANAKGYSVSPFGAGALFALMWCGLYLPAIAGEYLIANILVMDKLADIYAAITTVFVLLAAYFMHKRVKKPMNVVLVGLYTLLSQVVSLYYIYNIGAWLDCIIFAAVAVVFLYVCVNVFQTFVLRGVKCNFTLDELVCLVALIVVMTFGIADFQVFGFSVYKLLAVFGLFALIAVNQRQFSLTWLVAIGLGVSVARFSLNCLAELTIIGVMANIFAFPHKYRICISALIGDIVTQAYFSGVGVEILHTVMPTAVAVVIFLMVPNAVWKKCEASLGRAESGLGVKNVISSTRKSVHHKMAFLSDVFAQMQQIHLKLIGQELTAGQVKDIVCGEVLNSICAACKNKHICHRAGGVAETSPMSELVQVAIVRGKISALDLPISISQSCGMSNLLIGKINQHAGQYNARMSLNAEVNNIKFLLAEQMGAVSRLFLNLGENINQSIAIDGKLQPQIINGLLGKNILCSEVLVFSQNEKDIEVVAIISGDGAYNPEIEGVVSRAVGAPMMVVEVEPTDVKDCYSVKLRRTANREIVFGICSRTKTGSVSSGDCHTLIKLDGNKYLMALCDGMGSGEKAREMSALAIGLVENFYRAGFEDEFILNNINRLLTLNNQECFSTLDLCVVDLSREIVDFVKLGATYGVIKRENVVDKVESSALPLGVVGNVNPSISHWAVHVKDMIVMVTDGITDAFDSYVEFADYINALEGNNPQVLAQAILDEAVRRDNGVAKDDMTVLIARIFLKR